MSLFTSVRRTQCLRTCTSCYHNFRYTCKMMISLGVFFILLKFWFFGSLGEINGKKQPKMKNKNYAVAPYFRNSVAYDHDFLYTCVNWWYLQLFCSNLSKFWFSGSKLTKNISVSLRIPGNVQHGFDFWYTWVKWWCFQQFFLFFDFFRGVKAKKWPKINLSHYISGTVYHIIKVFGTQV